LLLLLLLLVELGLVIRAAGGEQLTELLELAEELLCDELLLLEPVESLLALLAPNGGEETFKDRLLFTFCF